jgi:copper transport protein
VLAVVADGLHLVAMAAWFSGLLLLLTLLASQQLPQTLWRVLVPQFSRLALVSVFTLSVTGLGMAFWHVRTWEALTATTYGRVLGAKVSMFGLLVGLGAVNLLLLSPRLKERGQMAVAWLRRTVPMELLLGGLVLLTVAILTGVAPAWEALEAQHRLGFVETAVLDEVRLTLRIAPAQIGENEFGVDIVDNRSGANESESMVILRFQTADVAGITQVETTTTGNGRFTTRGSYLALAGTWEVNVILRRAGFDDVTHTFQIQLESEGHHHDS